MLDKLSHHQNTAPNIDRKGVVYHALGDAFDGIKAVYSPEPVDASAVITDGVDEQNKVSNVGTISYLPAAFGIFCASVVINDLLGK